MADTPPTAPQTTRWAVFKKKKVWIPIAVVLVIGLIGSLGDNKEADTKNAASTKPTITQAPPKVTTTQAPKAPKVTTFADTKEAKSSGLACRQFRATAGDAQKGILTNDELRKKLKEVNENAIIGTPAVQLAAQHSLAGITSGDAADFGVAVKEMDSACTTAGH